MYVMYVYIFVCMYVCILYMLCLLHEYVYVLSMYVCMYIIYECMYIMYVYVSMHVCYFICRYIFSSFLH